MERIGIEEYKTLCGVQQEGGVSLTEQQENYIKPLTWFDQINGAHWVSIKTLKECVFFCPNEKTYRNTYNLKELVTLLEARQ
jgi:hypothetical protein